MQVSICADGHPPSQPNVQKLGKKTHTTVKKCRVVRARCEKNNKDRVWCKCEKKIDAVLRAANTCMDDTRNTD